MFRLSSIIKNTTFFILFFISTASFSDVDFDSLSKTDDKTENKAYSRFSNSDDLIEESTNIQRTIEEKEMADSERRNERRKEYEESHPKCQSSRKSECFEVHKSERSGKNYIVTCTHGREAGKKKEICQDHNGRWEIGGCSLLLGNTYSTLEKAAEEFCDL